MGQKLRPGVGPIPNTDALLKAGKELHSGRLTRARHAFHKHASRNPHIWGKVQGNPEYLNKCEEACLKEIIYSNVSVWWTDSGGKRYLWEGSTIRVNGELPDGRGARWSEDGIHLWGFTDPPRI